MPNFRLLNGAFLKANIAIFLFCCLVLPFLGTYIWFQGRIASARDVAALKIKKTIPPDDEILWKFSLADSKNKLEWEHSQEFEYNGEMYDVIRSEQKGDTMWYWCYWDRKETLLKKELNLLTLNLLGPGATHQNHGQRIDEFFKTLYPPELIGKTHLALQVPNSRCNTSYYFSLALHLTTPPAPPPWIC